MWSNVVTLFREYMGTGLVVIFYLVSVLFLFLREKSILEDYHNLLKMKNLLR